MQKILQGIGLNPEIYDKKMSPLILILFIIFFSSKLFATDSVETLNRFITMTNNDAEEHFDGSVDLASSDLEMTLDDNVQTIGLRFTNITIPPDAKIISSYIQFETDEVLNSEKSTFNIYVQETANAKYFLTIPFNITSRKKSREKVIWKPFSWLIENERSELQQTADLSILVQHTVENSAWKSGNSMAFIIKGEGKRVAKAYLYATEESISQTASLHISYALKKDSLISLKKDSISTTSIAKSSIVINEILTANSESNEDPDKKKNSDWIELCNRSNKSVDISGYYLSNSHKNLTKWKFPQQKVLPPSSYLLVWADGLNDKLKAYHSNFKLDQKGGELFLLNQDKQIIDRWKFPKQQPDISYQQENNITRFMLPTPMAKNNKGMPLLKKSKKPHLSNKSGFYMKPIEVALRAEANATLYYTLDGSEPSEDSLQYVKPIKMSQTTVLKAVSIEENAFKSSSITQTYFFNEDFSIPVVSLVCDSKNLYDKESGIVTNHDKKWMKKASVEYFKEGKSKFMKNIGLKISGNNTRGYPQKSFAIYFKHKYGPKSLKYALFPDKPQIKKVKSFTLRNGGTFMGHSLIAEGISHLIVKDNMDIDYQSYHPVILFLNGDFHGIYNIRERMNKEYIKANHKISKIDLIENNEEYDAIKEGNIDTFYEFIDYIKTHDMKDDGFYKIASSKMDMQEFINHNIVESYFGNSSIQHNVKRWKEKKNGKWRTLLFDLDRGFGGPKDEVLEYLMDGGSTNVFFTYFIQNEKFVNDFLSRYFTHLNTTFQPKRVNHFIDTYKNKIDPYVARHFEKWNLDGQGNKVSKKSWLKYIDDLYAFSEGRHEVVRESLRETFGLEGKPSLSVDMSDNGTVYLDDIKLEETFHGEYFNKAYVTLKAVASEGYKFKSWSNGNKNSEIKVMMHHDINLSVEFIKDL